MTEEEHKIEFNASVYSARTLVDNGIRVSFDLSEDCVFQMGQLIECKRHGILLKIFAFPDFSVLENRKKEQTENETDYGL